MLNLKEKRQLIVSVLILLTLIFIFVQSSLPTDVSHKESEAVGDAVGDVVSGVGSDSDGKKSDFVDFLKKNLRKMAHFTEYAILGAEVFVLLLFACGNKEKSRLKPPFGIKALLYSIAFPVIVSFVDESIQIISKRGYSILDMWIDVLGYLTSTLILYAVFFFIGKKRTK